MSNEDLTNIIDDFKKLNFITCQKSADMNDPDGLYWLGYCYEYGIGVEKDENRAFTYYQKSADMNNSKGMYQVGYCYYLGIGVKMDKCKAFTYYLKSAEAGNFMGSWKTAICYKFGIGVEKSDRKFDQWFKKDEIANSHKFIRNPENGKCSLCNKNNTSPAWCLSCDPDITTRWTTGNKEIDDCMKTFQLRAKGYEYTIEWIPFDRLSNIEKIGQGGFGSVYSAFWLDGMRKVEKINDGDSYIYKPTRKSSIVALKTLPSSKENNFDFLKEFKNHMECKLNNSKLAVYGITQNTETNEYLMAFQYAKDGCLHKYLRKNFTILTWQDKLQMLKYVSEELNDIHYYAGYIHADFHSGNILQDERSYIADLGLSRKKDEKISEGNIYGVMPYVAPEVLSGEQQFTKEADIYGFGVIMVEMSSGQRPFDGTEFDTKLATKICKGKRPVCALGTPKCYIELAEQCMNSDPKKRPSAYVLWTTIDDWLNKLVSSNDNEIQKQFLDADKDIKSLPISKHSDEKYTSKNIITEAISKEIKADSAQVNLDITEV